MFRKTVYALAATAVAVAGPALINATASAATPAATAPVKINVPATYESMDTNHDMMVSKQEALAAMPNLKVIVALGAIAHQALAWAHGIKAGCLVFGHNVHHELPDGRLLVDSYHCSGYNWRTGRLSRESFEAVFAGIRRHLGG